MLRYSDHTVAQISYRLHYPNISFFYLYFKRNTGLTSNSYRED